MSKYYPTKKFIKSKSIWAVYKGEECLAIGDFNELEKKLNLTRDTLFYYVSDSYKKRLLKMKQKETNITFVLVEEIKGEPLDLSKYNKRKCENEK